MKVGKNIRRDYTLKGREETTFRFQFSNGRFSAIGLLQLEVTWYKIRHIGE